MRRRRDLVAVASAAVIVASLMAPVPAASAGSMIIPSSGTIGNTGYFLSCRSTSSLSPTTEYYDQNGQLETWDCGEGKRPHKGVDILGDKIPGATSVHAAADGTVMQVRRGSGMGWYVAIRHGPLGANGLHTYTIYGHMGDCDTGDSLIASGIERGVAVTSGQLLGWQGNDATGCGRSHLHWEVRASKTDVSNVFLATPASPDYYTGVQLTADDPAKVSSVTSPAAVDTPAPAPTGPPLPPPTTEAPPTTSAPPTASPDPGSASQIPADADPDAFFAAFAPLLGGSGFSLPSGSSSGTSLDGGTGLQGLQGLLNGLLAGLPVGSFGSGASLGVPADLGQGTSSSPSTPPAAELSSDPSATATPPPLPSPSPRPSPSPGTGPTPTAPPEFEMSQGDQPPASQLPDPGPWVQFFVGADLKALLSDDAQAPDGQAWQAFVDALGSDPDTAAWEDFLRGDASEPPDPEAWETLVRALEQN